MPCYKESLFQAKLYTEVTWSVSSMDATLGLVGGVSAMLWGGIGWLLEGYQAFTFKNDLISQIYPTSPQPDDDDSDGEDGGKKKKL